MRFIYTPEAPLLPVGAYAQATARNGIIYVLGRLPITRAGEIFNGIRAKTKQILNNMIAILRFQGTSTESVLKVQISTTSLSSFQRELLLKSALPIDNLVEIDSIAIDGV